MIRDFGHGPVLKGLLSGLLLSACGVTPALAIEMRDLLVDSLSQHPEVKEKIHVYRQVVSDQDIASSGWRAERRPAGLHRQLRNRVPGTTRQ